jgi:CreA protein
MAVVSNFKSGLTIAMTTRDRKAAVEWYSRHLGFSLLYDVEEIGWCELSTHMEGVTVGFAESPDASPGNSTPVWEVDDLDGARISLEKAGVRFDGPTEVNEGMVKLATFFDPDNNAMMLSQSLMSH